MSASPCQIKAGDRGRTGDIQLGKLNPCTYVNAPHSAETHLTLATAKRKTTGDFNLAATWSGCEVPLVRAGRGAG